MRWEPATGLNQVASVGIEARINTLQRDIREAQKKESTIIHDFCSDNPRRAEQPQPLLGSD